MGSSVILPTPGQPKTGPDPSFQSASVPSLVTFEFNDLVPPSNVYINTGDGFAISWFSQLANINPVITARLLLPFGPISGQPDRGETDIEGDKRIRIGQVVIFQQQLNAAAVGIAASQFFPLQEGYLLSVSAGVLLGQVVKRGQTYVSLGLQRASIGGFRYQELFADYIVNAGDTGWPNGRIIQSTEGPGNALTITVANPAAGADWTQAVPVGARWRLVSWAATLTTSATVANRLVRAQITDAGNIPYSWGAPTQAVPASTAAIVSALQSTTPPVATETSVACVVPSNPYLFAGDKIGTNTLNIQAGDQWSNIRIKIEQWVEN